jgi:hypothetical protein
VIKTKAIVALYEEPDRPDVAGPLLSRLFTQVICGVAADANRALSAQSVEGAEVIRGNADSTRGLKRNDLIRDLEHHKSQFLRPAR